jgi:hypothetical protein
MKLRTLVLAIATCVLTMPVLAQHAATPYAGQQTRTIKALSPEDIAGLLEGEGMGMAKAAELNDYPDPVHVLALARELDLTASQRERRASGPSAQDGHHEVGPIRLVRLRQAALRSCRSFFAGRRFCRLHEQLVHDIADADGRP